jgi:hypothetical protein
MGKFIDLTGMRFSRLIVIKRATNKNKVTRWHCKCDCGNTSIVQSCALKSGHTKSCGCYNKERSKEVNSVKFKKYNRYDLESEDYAIGYTLNSNKEFYFDKKYYNKIKEYCWFEGGNGYLYALVNGKVLLLHRFILDVNNYSQRIDHINHQVLDCREINLRITTNSQNQMNKKLLSNNTSGVTGVCFNKKINKWQAIIEVNTKRIDLGRYDDFNEAVEARKQAEEKYFKEYSYDNSMKKAKENNI